MNKPVRIRIKENSWIARLAAWKLGTRTVAITLGRTIHLHRASRSTFLQNPPWIRHELMHVRQFQRYGLLRFLLLYTWESLRKGYRNNKWEIEARAAERDDSILDTFDFQDKRQPTLPGS